MRIYDPRLGRFLSVDPISKDYPQLTPYQFASNRAIDGTDKDGLEWEAKLFWDVFVQPFLDFGNGASKYAEGTVQKVTAQTGRADYQNSNVPQHVQEQWGKRDIANGTSKQIRGGTEMIIATADVVNTYVPLGTEGLITIKSSNSAAKTGKGLFKVPDSFVEGSFENYLNIAKNGNFSTPKNSAVFYSGPGQRSLAQEFIANTPGKMTIEGTEGGKLLDGANLYKRFSAQKADAIWAEASKLYTSKVTGEAHAFIKGATQDRQYLSIEKPILNKKMDVKLIEYK